MNHEVPSTQMAGQAWNRPSLRPAREVESRLKALLRTGRLKVILRAWLMLVPAVASGAEQTVDFNRDIRPILSENCFACHGFDEKARQGDLRLDQRDAAISAKAIVPGKVDESELWRRVVSDDPETQMPPPKSNLHLSDRERAKLKAWIEQGAPYAGHWSFIPPTKPPLPTGVPPAEKEPAGSELSPIDAFVRARLADEGLKPAPEADRATLIRRVSLDLIGLPPTAEEVAAFEADTDPRAYEKLVDRLLQNEHFGERLALEWLDAARYADTNGFSIDGGRHMWLWRDWVIQAFNDNLPYDQFLRDQLAGDLLPNHTDAQLIATGFQRNNMVTHEGGTIPEENLVNYNADRVKTLGEAILGLTMGCVQCHNHKFDPITMRDYYQLFAFWNTLSDRGLDGNAGINPAPSVSLKTVLKTHDEPAVRQRIDELKSLLNKLDPAVLDRWERGEQERLAQRGRNLKLLPVKALKVSTPNRGAGFEIENNRVLLRAPGDLGAFDISTEMPASDEPITGLRVIMHPSPDLPGGGWGHGPVDRPRRGKKATDAPDKGTFVLTAIAATADTTPGDQVNLHRLLPISRVTASSWEDGFRPEGCLDPRNDSGWSPDPAATGSVHLTATFSHPVDSRENRFLTVQLNFGQGKAQIAGVIEIQAMTGTDDGTDLPADVVAALGIPADKRDAAARERLWKHCSQHGAELAAKRTELANQEERLRVLTEPFTTMVMDVSAKPRETFVLHRGDYSKPTDKVEMGTIASLPPMPADAPRTRLGLAQWVTMAEHPLTARVAVNRFWKICFGIGIVGTAADFGSQGEWPSHPDLLDWLAVDFRESGWDVKRFLRQIVLSQTYRQSSAASTELLERDPQNRLLARGPRFRLPAELVRDSILKSSGLLVERVGGPSVNPYTPGDLWREISHYGSSPATAQTFVQDHGEKLYRRSLYTYWKRTVPPPNMVVFDAPNREVCTVSRASTTTPLQSLVLLNDPQFVEAARVFAERILSRPGDDSARLAWAWRTATSRSLSDREAPVLSAALQRERTRYRANPPAAAALLSVGESPRDLQLDPAEHAAWTQLGSLMFNLSEVVTRN